HRRSERGSIAWLEPGARSGARGRYPKLKVFFIRGEIAPNRMAGLSARCRGTARARGWHRAILAWSTATGPVGVGDRHSSDSGGPALADYRLATARRSGARHRCGTLDVGSPNFW